MGGIRTPLTVDRSRDTTLTAALAFLITSRDILVGQVPRNVFSEVAAPVDALSFVAPVDALLCFAAPVDALFGTVAFFDAPFAAPVDALGEGCGRSRR